MKYLFLVITTFVSAFAAAGEESCISHKISCVGSNYMKSETNSYVVSEPELGNPSCVVQTTFSYKAIPGIYWASIYVGENLNVMVTLSQRETYDKSYVDGGTILFPAQVGVPFKVRSGLLEMTCTIN